jgi:DNA-directed RNA polymerase subunit E'/Rpb7
MFLPIRFKVSVQLAPYELGSDYDAIILEKLRKTYEGVCTRFGYLRPKSIEIVSRSMGQFMKQHFNGYIRFEIKCRGEVCNPAKGAVVEAVVRKKNELGIHAESLYDGVPILDIIVPKRAAGIVSEVNLDAFQINDTMFVEIVGKRYQLHDHTISIIGRGVEKPSDKQVEKDEIVEDDTGVAPDLDPTDDFELVDVEAEGSDEEEDEDKKAVVVGGDEEDSEDSEEEEVVDSEEEFPGDEDEDEEPSSEGGFDDDF